MAIGAYASVLSLMDIVDNALHPFHSRYLPNTNQIQTLLEKLGSLRDVLEKLPSKINKEIEDLARQIREITDKADDVIDNYMVEQKSKSYQDKIYDVNMLVNATAVDYEYISSRKDNRTRGLDEDVDHVIRGYIMYRNIGGRYGDQDHDVEDMSDSSFYENIDRVIQNIDSIKQKMTMALATEENREMGVSDQNPPKVPVREDSSSEAAFDDKSTAVVGFDKPLLEIMEKLSGNERKLQIIPIIGMGGIGKTTLARYAFDDKCIVENFTIRIWLTISQEYDAHHILKGLLNGVLGDGINKSSCVNIDELKQQLYQELCGRKYLIVMDDVWTIQAWDDLKLFFPDNGNGSRIIVTSRLSNVANALSSTNSFSMVFLDENSSWDLFSKKAFGRGVRSPELEETGKKISRSCRGLPLALVVMGGLLANSNMTRVYWEFVAENVSSFANSENDESCLKILSLSYTYLPIHLKLCFLYMSVFPEDSSIRVSELIQAWITEGLVRPTTDKTLEEAALESFKDLIDRNLIEIRTRGTRGSIKYCSIHDLLRDLCERESNKEHLLSRVPRRGYGSPGSLTGCFLCPKIPRFIKVPPRVYEIDLFCMPSKSVGRSLVCNPCRTRYPRLMRLRCVRLISRSPVGVSIDYKLQTTKSRHVVALGQSSYAWPMKLLWNMKIVHATFTPLMQNDVFSEIWEMPQLRFLKCLPIYIPDPPADDFAVLENLQKLKIVFDFRLTEEVVKRTSNLKKLGLSYNLDSKRNSCYYCLYNLHLWRKLESISLTCFRNPLDMENINFPCSLKKLRLWGCRFSWEYINNTVGLLPNLEALALRENSVVGAEWKPIEGRFLRLKCLRMLKLELMRWDADETHFPLLETLILAYLPKLEKIPSGFGDMNTLQSISLGREVRESVIDSVKEIIDEQSQSHGVASLRLEFPDMVGRPEGYELDPFA